MVDQEQQLEEQQEQIEDQFAEADAKGEAEAPPSIEDLASTMGWVPKEKFGGDGTQWKPADQFIRDGRDIQRKLSRELSEVRSTMDTIAKTSGAILAERLAEQRAELATEYAKAIEDGDPDKAWKAANGIIRIDNQKTEVVRPAPAPETNEWVAKNPWFTNDPLARSRAIAVADVYARDGKSSSEQFAAAERAVKAEFPHLFTAADKAPPGVNSPGSRVASTQKGNGKTAADLPREAREVADDMVDRGLIKSPDDYARNYFAQKEKAA